MSQESYLCLNDPKLRKESFVKRIEANIPFTLETPRDILISAGSTGEMV